MSREPGDSPLAPPCGRPRALGLPRRRFLGVVVGAAGAALTSTGCATSGASGGAARASPEPTSTGLSTTERATLAALQDILLPSAPGSPGARDVNAIAFLDGVLARKEVPRRVDARIRAGVVDLDEAARALEAPTFRDAALEEREAAVAAIARRYKGRRFLRYVLEHTLEAFLGDPVHGGNPEEIAWRYLGHRPGYPRPPLVDEDAP